MRKLEPETSNIFVKIYRSWIARTAAGCGAVLVLLSLWMTTGEDLFGDFEKKLRKDFPEEQQAMMVAIAKFCHTESYSRAWKETPSRRRGPKNASPAIYEETQRGLILSELATVKRGTRIEPTVDALIGTCWEHRDILAWTMFSLGPNRFQQLVGVPGDHTYRQAPRDQNTYSGDWRLEDGVITWTADDTRTEHPNPVILLTEDVLVIQEMEGHYTYWRRVLDSREVAKYLSR